MYINIARFKNNLTAKTWRIAANVIFIPNGKYDASCISCIILEVALD